MPTGDRGGAQTKKLTPRQKRTLRVALTKLQTAPATSEHSNGQSRTDRKPRTTSPKGTFAEVMARKQKPQQATIGLNPADVKKLHALARSHDIGNLASKTVGELAQSAIYSIPGAYEVGKAVGKDANDLADATRHAVRPKFGLSAGPTGSFEPKRSVKVGKQIVKSTVEDLKHPLRHPGFTLMDAWGLASAGAGTAARAGAAGQALRAGEGLAKAAGRSSAKGGSLLHAPNPGRVTVKEGDLKVQVPAFRNPAARAVQKAYHRSKDFKPGAKRVGKALAAERRVTEPLERAPAASLAAKGKRLTTPQERALQVVAEGTPIDARIRLHLQDARKAAPKERLRLRNEIRLLRAAKAYVEDVNGVPTLRKDFQTPKLGGKFRTRRGAGPERLQATFDQAVKVDTQREKTLIDAGSLTPSQVEARKHAPGRVVLGAEHVKTPAKKGRVEQTRTYPARSKTVTRPRTVQEARARVAEIDAVYEDVLAKIAGGYEAKTAKGITAGRNVRNSRVDPARRMPTVKGEARKLAEKQLTVLLEKNAHPTMQRLNAMLDEEAQLTEALHAHELDGTAHLGDVSQVIPGKPRSVRLREIKAQRASSGLQGAEDFKGGLAYVPYKRSLAPRSHGQAQAYKGGLPKPLSSTTHGFTGRALRSVNYRKKTSQVIAEAGVEAQRYGAVLRLRDAVIKAGHDVHPDDGRDYVAVRTAKFKGSPTLTELSQKAEAGAKLSKQEKLTLGRGAQAVADHIFPDTAALTSHKGIKWVPKELLDGLNDPHAQLSAVIGSSTVKTVDAINNATRAAVLYLKPAYAVPNVLGNAALNIVQQGFAAPGNLARAAHVNAKLGEDAVAALDAGMGEGFAQALAGDTGLGTRAIQGLANTWSKGVDTPFRRSAFIYEARRLGYKSAVELKALLLDDAHAADRLEAFQRANKEIIDYSRLGKREREIVRRVVFFYPWVKGSTMYAGHFAVEHPIKAAAVVQLGRQGEAKAKKDLGPGPSYTDGEFKVNIPGRIGDMLGRKPGEPLVVNPASASILGTPAQVALAAKALASGNFRKADKLTNFLTPAAGVANDLINNRDSFTDRPLKGNLGDKLKQELVGSLPQARLVDTLRHPGKGKLHPVTRTGALAKFGIGSIAPSPENLDARHELAYQEGSSNLSPGEKAYRSVFKERNQLHADAVDAGLIGPHDKLPEPLRTAYNLKAEREAAWDTASHGKSPGSPEYQFARYQADVRFLVKHGQLDKNEVRDAVAWGNANKADIEALKNKRRWITDTYYQPGFLNEINTRKHELAAAKG